MTQARLFVPAFEILQVNAKAERDNKIQGAAPNRPGLTASRIILPLPSGKENEKDHCAGYQDFVSRDKFHRSNNQPQPMAEVQAD
jgi:hypothetical protein